MAASIVSEAMDSLEGRDIRFTLRFFFSVAVLIQPPS